MFADANERRDLCIYANFAQRLISPARKLYAADTFGMGLSNTVYALDFTTIDLAGGNQVAKHRIRSVGHTPDQPMLHRIDVGMIHMRAVVRLAPKSDAPNTTVARCHTLPGACARRIISRHVSTITSRVPSGPLTKWLH